MTDTIRINSGNLSTALELRAATCLAGSTHVDSDPAGHVVIARNWPSLSSGETLIWSVMGWLNGQDDLPDMASLEATLDSGNFAAVKRVLAAEGVTA